MKPLNANNAQKQNLPIKVIQFGEGNFLRAFTNWMIDIMNTDHEYNHGVAIVQPIKTGMVNVLQDQDNMYHHVMRGLKQGKVYSETRLINCVQKSINPFEDIDAYKKLALLDKLELVISNTTEAGIVFSDEQKEISDLPITFPGKITKLLWDRFVHFDGDESKGLLFLPVELIEQNGDKLKDAVLKYAALWNLPKEFNIWIKNNSYFANTLVDRIVTGYPANEINEIQKKIGYSDNLVVASELFHLFVIEANENLKASFSANKMGFNVIFTNDITPYRTRKVRILNGTHTCMVSVGLYNGLATVGEAITDKTVGNYIKNIVYNEIIPTINLPENELISFADEVFERFKNPTIVHKLTDISLNSISKYKVRVLPTVFDYYDKYNKLPNGLILALTHLIRNYLSDNYVIKDNADVVLFFNNLKSSNLSETEIINKVLTHKSFWDSNLTEIPGLLDVVVKQYKTLY